MSERRILGPPRPWHVVLSPVVPVFALLSANFAALLPGAALRAVALLVPAVLLGWAILAWLVGNARSAALVVSLLTLLALSQSTVVQLARVVSAPELVPMILLATLAVCGVMLYRGGELAGPTMFANALMVASTILVTHPILAAEIQAWRRPTLRLEALPLTGSNVRQKPDVYIIVVDGYGRADVLRECFQFENPLVGELERLGFAVSDQAISNYAQTAQSLASSLNLDYLPTLLEAQKPGVEPRQRLADLISENRMFATLKSAGYRIRFYASEYGLIGTTQAHERPTPLLNWTDFEYGLHDNSVVPLLSAALGLPVGSLPSRVHRRQVRWVLDHLESHVPPVDSPPTLVFAHLLIPHPPFSFEADGTPLKSKIPANLSDGSHWHTQAVRSGESYQTGYVKGLQFLNARLLAIIGAICSRQNRPAIIYLQSDHGPGSRLDWDDAARTDMRERLGILLAARFPDGSHRAIPEHTSAVNGFRFLLNAALRLDLPLLEDRAFFSPWRQPLHFIDVTDRVRGAPEPATR